MLKIFVKTLADDNVKNIKYMMLLLNDKQEIFDLLYEHGNLGYIKILREISPHIDIHANNENAFRCACREGYFDIVKWLWGISRGEMKKPIDIHVDDEYAFRSSCGEGHLEIAKWLLEISIQNSDIIDIHARDDVAFCWSCEGGYIDVAKWLWEISQRETKNLINIHVDYEYPFRFSCEEGHLDMAKWLWEISEGNINIHVIDDFAFRRACTGGHLDVAKWLWEVSQREMFDDNKWPINIHVDNDIIFKNSPKKVIEWIKSLK